jgi:hypothetical protein
VRGQILKVTAAIKIINTSVCVNVEKPFKKFCQKVEIKSWQSKE